MLLKDIQQVIGSNSHVKVLAFQTHQQAVDNLLQSQGAQSTLVNMRWRKVSHIHTSQDGAGMIV